MTELFAHLSLALPRDLALPLFILSLPICVWVAWSDMRAMRIPNYAVLALVAIFLVVAPFVMSLQTMGWQLSHLVIILLVGIALNAAGLVGAGDAKFAAAAAPYIAFADLRLIAVLFAVNLLAGFATHRLAKYTSLRQLATDWKSWSVGSKFPMGLCLGGTLAIYLILAAFNGQ